METSINQMNPSFRKAITWNGFRMDEVKSGMQKYIRRGNFEKAIYCAIEMDLFSETNEGSAKAFRTNMMNRLLIITCEDVTLANPYLPVHVNKLYEEWCYLRKEQKNISRQRDILCSIIKLLCSSPKLRYFSCMRAAFFNPLTENWVRKYYPELWEIEWKKPKLRVLCPEQYRDELEKLAYCIESKNNLAFHYMAKFMYSTKKLETKVLKHSQPIYLVWELIFAYVKKIKNQKIQKAATESINVLYKWFNTHKSEHHLFVGQALGYLVRRKEIKYFINDSPQIDHSEYYQKNFQNMEFKLDDFCLDIHTKFGRDMKKTKFQFVVEGAHVENKATDIIDEKFQEIYISTGHHTQKIGKKVIFHDEPPLQFYEKDVFADIVRAQLLCSKSRPDVYYATYQNRPVVVKGPYIEDSKLDSIIYTAKQKNKYLGIEIVDYVIIELIPIHYKEFGNPENFGTRTKIKPNQKYKFLVMENVCWHKPTKIPVTTKSSKLWPETQVADISKINMKEGTILDIPQQFELQLILALLYRYIYQISDTCKRNLIFTNGKVYSIDEESYRHESSLKNLYSKPMPDHERKLFKRAVERNWLKIKHHLEIWMDVQHEEWVGDNIQKLLDKNFVLNLL